eukprot:TRINITY_DN6130_c0_g1_i3.p1 TRINITY_DN6130_c0_g1~~TRINITY_DN6130_c0_g1_i3.p1  ORF type:complete len:157 (-),score=4.30 TRINITY_DN6130_c0_g1_i3:155-571(-)
MDLTAHQNITSQQSKSNENGLPQAAIGRDESPPKAVPAYDYVNYFFTSIHFLDREIPKTNSDVKSTWSRNTLIAQVPSFYYHFKSVEEVFQANNEFDNLFALQVSYFPKLLINKFPSFKRSILTSSVHEHTKFHFASE